MDFSLRELMNLSRFKPNFDENGNNLDAGPVIKPNAGSGLTNSQEQYWKQQYNATKDSLKTKDAVGSNAGTPWGLIAGLGAANLIGLTSGFNPDYKFNELNGIAGQSNRMRNGVGYMAQNSVDGGKIMSQYDDTTRNQFLSGNILGGLSRTLFGRGEQQDQIREQKLFAQRSNAYNGNYAATTGMQQDFAEQYGNPEYQTLFKAALGTDSYVGPAIMKPNEYKVDAEYNIEKPEGGIYDEDSVPVYINYGDKVATDEDFGNTGKTYARQLDGLYMYQQYLNSISGRNKGEKNSEIEQNVIKGAKRQVKDQVKAIMDAQANDPVRQAIKMVQDTSQYIPHAAIGIDNPILSYNRAQNALNLIKQRIGDFAQDKRANYPSIDQQIQPKENNKNPYGLKNVNYEIRDLINMGNAWRKDVQDLNSNDFIRKPLGINTIVPGNYSAEDIGNAAQAILGGGIALAMHNWAKNQDVANPNLYARNTYATRALKGLHSLNTDDIAINRAILNQNAAGNYQISSAGGLNTGQKTLSRLALNYNAQNAIANAMAQARDRKNALLAQAYNADLQTGAQAASDWMRAEAARESIFQQAASNRNNIMWGALSQIPSIIGTYAKGAGTSARHKDMMALYSATLDDEARKYYNKYKSR